MDNDKDDTWRRVLHLHGGSTNLSLITVAGGAFLFGIGLARWRDLISDLLSLSTQ